MLPLSGTAHDSCLFDLSLLLSMWKPPSPTGLFRRIISPVFKPASCVNEYLAAADRLHIDYPAHRTTTSTSLAALPFMTFRTIRSPVPRPALTGAGRMPTSTLQRAYYSVTSSIISCRTFSACPQSFVTTNATLPSIRYFAKITLSQTPSSLRRDRTEPRDTTASGISNASPRPFQAPSPTLPAAPGTETRGYAQVPHPSL
jgi:hypothetical protein